MAQEWSRATTDDGQTFVYADEGEGPLVVLLHGYPDTPFGWASAASVLSGAGFRTVRPWLRGYHPDTVVEGRPYDALTIARDPAALLDAIGADNAILVGHDWGAAITWGAATVTPERFRAIVPVAIPHNSLLPRSLGTLFGARHFFALKMPGADSAVRRRNFAYLDRLYSRWAPDWSGPDRDRALADVKEAFADEAALKGAGDYYRALSFKPIPEYEKLPDVRGLVVGGTEDIVPPGPFIKSAERLADGSKSLIIEGAGHWPHREGEAEFNEALLAFVRDV